ncbi:ATP-binding protein [Lactococcus fujiensis]|uniref:ATPase n=1 Tax=Lactococcus fujiensis JCM 16395 TaxID=1291764 RepID=A0A2A5RIH3_9LACT|nr:ATP-binding protein [Lactococcus fujiensis]PCR98886.1 ATPase [Lactococcus fujiensis JCM 16395]
MFVGRKKELEHLNQAYQSDKFQFVVMYGRRRVGKTTLLNEFLKDKRGSYYMAIKEKDGSNLNALSESILGEDSGLSFDNYEKALMNVYEQGKDERFVLVLDEFPYLASSAPEISSIIQKVIDHHFINSKVMLILCGSSMSFMEHQVLGYESPLYGRRTSQMKIQPFTFFQCQEFFPKMNKEELLGVYGITSGIPQYLSFIDENKSLEDNIKLTYLKTTAPLYEEPSNLLMQELRDPSNYNSILYSIAHGASRIKDIAGQTKLTSAATSLLLDNLIELGIVEKKTPISQKNKNSRKTIYTISDSMFRFWYRFVGKNQSQIERDRGDFVYKRIEKEINDFLGPVFEKVSIDWMWEHVPYDLVDDYFEELGTWWGTDKAEKKEVELDIVGFSPMTGALFVGECKWRNQLLDEKVLNKLIYRAGLFSNSQKYYFLFSKSGFSQGVMKEARNKGVYLISFDQMTE